MSLVAPTRRLVPKCLSCTAAVPPLRLQQHQRRTAADKSSRNGSSPTPSGNSATARPNPILDEYMKKNNITNASAPASPMQTLPKPGDIAPGSVFEDDRRIQVQARREERQRIAAEDGEQGKSKEGGAERDPKAIARVLNPDPNARERWERKKVIQMVRKGGRVSRELFVKRTEREHLVKSHNLKTSVKKLGMLARQISGKTIDDAITQMRFSKKKVAQEVLKQLEFARDEAVVMRGMGLQNPTVADAVVAQAAEQSIPAKPVEIQKKDGSRHKVTDPSKIYIDQAWVGRGPYGQLPDYRARGRVYIMRTPWTSISLLLKEEATRVREYQEREVKRLKQRTQNAWVPLPDRPIQVQRQWFSW